MSFPKTGGPEWAGSQASPWTPVNEAHRRLDALASRAIVADRDLTAPPGACADGANYLVKAAATGLWAGKDGKLATAVGANAANGWLFQTVAVEGYRLRLQDEDIEIEWDGAAWVSLGGSSSTVAPTTQAGTAYTAVIGDAGGYILFTNAGAITFTIPPNSSVPFPIGTVIAFEQNGAGTVTIAPDTGVTINSRGGFYATAGTFAVAQIKQIAADTWTLIGDVA